MTTTFIVNEEDRQSIIYEHAVKKVVIYTDANRVDVAYVDGSTDTFREASARELKGQISPSYAG